MEKSIFIVLTAGMLAMTFTACRTSSKEQLVETFKFRQNAVTCQVGNLVDEIGQTYTDPEAAMKDLDTFIRQNPRVEQVTLASIPMAIHPFSISLTEVQRGAPTPLGKYIPRKRFNRSENMVWYRKLLQKQDPFWYQSENNDEMLSYIYPVLKEFSKDIVLYVVKLDFDKRDNPILFWNVPQKYYAQELLRKEMEYLKRYFFLKKEAEKKRLTKEEKRKFKEAKIYYDLRFKEIPKAGIKREQTIEKLEEKAE